MTARTPSAATRTVRASIATDRAHGAVIPPLYLSTNFAFEGFGKPRTYDYTRSGNPTRAQLEDAIADLEGGAHAVVTSTGMSAVLLPFQLLNAGETVVAPHDCYGGTQRLLRSLATRGVLDVVFADLTSPAGIDVIRARRPKAVLIESPSNPLLRITDIRSVARAAHDVGARVIVDNTFLSPVLQHPIQLGADIVVHSTTKYLNGHSDVVGGAVVAADRATGEELAWWANCLGITGSPFDSYLTLRGLRTLFPRVQQHQTNAEHIVALLQTHDAVERVYYPGIASHPGHDIARAQQVGFGSMISFEVRGGARSVETLAASLRHFTLAESLGGIESLIAHPATMTHASMDAVARAAAGIRDSLVRISVGIESASDLVRDLGRGLDAVRGAVRSAVRAPVAPSIALPRGAEEPSDVILLGAGAIGRELLGQLAFADEHGSPLRVCGVVDRSGFILDHAGLHHARLREISASKAAGVPLRSLEGATLGTAADLLRAINGNLQRPIVADLTATDTSAILRCAFAYGCDAVLANKIPLSSDQEDFDSLLDDARKCRRRLLHEATVGAGLPVIDTLRKLLEGGDEIICIEGCPSGTLGFLFGGLSEGQSFSDALENAIALGYTEPDARTDLSGTDVARKALILARLIGFRGNLGDIVVESLVPEHLASVEYEEFIARVRETDDAWAARVAEASRAECVLRYRARITPTSITVGLTAVPKLSPLASLSGTDNQFAFTTSRYAQQPLVITGPGAGPAVTAAGVHNDLRRLAAEPR